jgi:hypothetical protein
MHQFGSAAPAAYRHVITIMFFTIAVPSCSCCCATVVGTAAIHAASVRALLLVRLQQVTQTHGLLHQI